MQRYSSRTNHPHRFLKRLMLLALLAIAAFALLLFRGRERGALLSGDAADAPRREASTYRNRSLLRPPQGPSPGEPESPLISGDVYATDGSTLAGATVIATTFEIAGNIPSTASSATSDERGHFQLRLPEGTYQLKAGLAGYGSTAAVAHSGDTVSLLLSRSGVIQGHVYNERKEPVRHFTIDVVSSVPDDAPATPPLWSQSFDSPDGSFRIAELPPWEVFIKATAADHAPSFSASLSVKPGEMSEVTLSLSRGCVLLGTVEDQKGTPLPRVFLDAEARLGAGSMSHLAMQAAADVQQTQSEADGSFRLEHVPMGEVRLRAYDGSNAVTTLAKTISDCNSVEPVKVVMSPGGSLRGVARREDGTPLAGAKLLLLARSVGFVNTTSDAEGRYHFDDLPPGPMRVELRALGRATMVSVRVKEGEETSRDITLINEGKGELRGRVTAGDKPLHGIRLMVAANHGRQQGFDRYFPVTDQDGAYRVSALPEGDYVVSAMSTVAGRGVHVDAGGEVTVNMDVAVKPASDETK